jgi:tetratricopeptide (TPR) repeat protein
MQIFKHCLLIGISIFILSDVSLAQQRSESDDFSYALKLYNEKLYHLASQQFSRFATNYPGSNNVAEAGYYSGMAIFYLKDYANARIEFQRVAVDFPRHDRAAESWFMIGECYSALDNEEEAAKAYEMVKLLHPQHGKAAESILRAGDIYLKMKKYDDAEQLYNLIQNRYVESNFYFPSYLAEAKLFLEKGQTSKANENLEKIIASNSDAVIKAQTWFYMGESYKAQGNYQLAISPYQKVIANYKSTSIYPDAAVSLSQIYLQQGNYTEAQKIITSALDNKPPTQYIVVMQEGLADAYYLGGKYALASKNYQLSLQSTDSSKYILKKFKLALSWHKQNNTIKAIETLRDIILKKKYHQASGFRTTKEHYFRWLKETNDYESAIADLYALKSMGALSQDDQIWLAGFLQVQQDWQGIIRELQPAIYSDSKFKHKDNFIYEVAWANEQLADYKESARYYKMLLDGYASSEFTPQAEKRLEYIRNYHLIDENLGIGQLAILMGDVISRKDDSQLQFNLGQLYYNNLKDYKSALIQFQTALQGSEDPSLQVEIYHYIGLTYQRLAEDEKVSETQRTEYLSLAKKILGKAMENLTASSEADLIAWHFVALGIKADKSTNQKQIGYYETLVKQYPDSPIREHWYARLGELYRESNEGVTSALKYYNLLSEQFRSSTKYPSYLYERSILNLKIDKTRSIEDFKTIAGSYPYSPPAANSLYNLGVVWEIEGSYSEASQLYTKIQNEYYYADIAAKANLRLGDCYLNAGKSTEAIALFTEVLDPIEAEDVVLSREVVSEDQAMLTFKLARAYFEHKEIALSRKHLVNYLANNPQGSFSGEASYLLGEIYLAINDPTSAVNSYSNVKKENGVLYTQALKKIADINFEDEKYDKAAENYKNLGAVIEDETEKAVILAKQIVSYIRSGKKSAADKWISIFNKNYKSQTNLRASFQFEFGNYNRSAKNYNQAVKYFKNVKSDYSKSSYVDDAEYYLALTYIAVNRHEEAIEILTEFPKKYPDSDNLGAVYNTLGGIYFRSENYESAITSFKDALDQSLKPDLRRQVMSNLIKAYTFVNFWDAALALAREYIETYPDAEDAIDKKILIGRAYVYLNQVDLAVDLLKEVRLIADSEREPEIQFYIGEAYFQTGQYENAIAEYVKIPLLSRKTKLQWEASALYYSGQAYEKLGRIDDAKRMYAEIVKRPGIDIVLKKEAQKRIKEIEK